MAGETLLNGRYRLVAQQGSGGMAVIYKAVDQELGRTVAVKILRPSLTSDPSFHERFRNEARSVANLSHPNIVTVHDVGHDGPTHYIVMEFVEGQDLKKIIRTYGALPIDRVLNLVIQICAGIGFAHRAGLVHADVKPQNILVTKDDFVKVTDFGIAQALSDTQPGQRQEVVWGSPHYFAPEQAKGERPTPASDVYSIGIVMFEMLTGRLPYMGANQQDLALAHIKDRVPLVSEFNPNVPDNLVRIVEKVMAKEPSARYRMADQLGQVLEAYRDRGQQRTAAGSSSHPPVPPPVPQSQPPTRPPAPLPSSQAQQPLRPADAPPTQRYSPAPNAPQSPGYGNQQPPVPSAAPQYPPPQGHGIQPLEQRFTPPPMPVGQAAPPGVGDSRQYYSQPYDPRKRKPAEQAESEGLDYVTIVLAALAFMAVACLFPLYIAVFQARLGG